MEICNSGMAPIYSNSSFTQYMISTTQIPIDPFRRPTIIFERTVQKKITDICSPLPLFFYCRHLKLAHNINISSLPISLSTVASYLSRASLKSITKHSHSLNYHCVSGTDNQLKAIPSTICTQNAPFPLTCRPR